MSEEFRLRHAAVRNEHMELHARDKTVLEGIWRVLDMRWLTIRRCPKLVASASAEHGCISEEFQLRHVAVRSEHTELHARTETVLGAVWSVMDMRWLTVRRSPKLVASASAEYAICERRVSTKACCRPK
jgi:hypothetical protein